ncbi:MAG: cyclopropane-fatty-acyl-phospholipid synthase family protein [Erythrobacter sp.]|nr:cyclopropane-fatty-acyl-phospholipid synthase family protein [Erythrobacter sp.]
MRGERLLSGGGRFAPTPGFFARLIAPGFAKILDRIDAGLERGSLVGHLPDGTTRMLGGRAPGFDAVVRLKDWRALLRLATNGTIGWYQAYEAGEWETDDMVAMFAVMSDNVRTLGNSARSSGPFKWAAALAHRFNRNDRAGSQRNIAAHYDLGNDFYAAWLDSTMTYSSGLAFAADGLEGAQNRKLTAIAERLGAPPTVLEIGCGWGAMADFMAKRGSRVTAISLSNEQLSHARTHCTDAIDFRKQDYRDVDGQFDAIVSVEMVEALGREYWPDFMDCVARNLKPGGRAALQYISISDDLFEAYSGTADFIQTYIFPGGLLIKSADFRELAEARQLSWQDEFRFGEDYAQTLRVWRERFDDAVARGSLPAGFDDRFIRLWRFYLCYCEAGFRAGNIDVHQVTLVKQ